MRDINKNKDIKKKVVIREKEWNYFIDCCKRYSDLDLFLRMQGCDEISDLTTMRDYIKNSNYDFPEYGMPSNFF